MYEEDGTVNMQTENNLNNNQNNRSKNPSPSINQGDSFYQPDKEAGESVAETPEKALSELIDEALHELR